MKKNELEKLIREIVRDEFRTMVKKYIVDLVDVMDELIDKKMQAAAKAADRVKPSKKDIPALKEGVEHDEWETLYGKTLDKEDVGMFGNTANLTDMLGYGDTINTGQSNQVDVMIDENGMPMPIKHNDSTKSVVDAMNRDYSSLLKAMDRKIQSTRGS